MAALSSPASRKNAPKPPRVASLDKVLSYRNPAVVERFRKDYPVSQKAAEVIWLDTLRWLWLCGRAKRGESLSVTGSMLVIDEMWHAFILFTKDYSEFCTRHFGVYVHHLPTTHAETVQFFSELRSNEAKVITDLESELRAQLGLVARELGAATLKRWYVDYRVRYSPEALRALRQNSLGA